MAKQFCDSLKPIEIEMVDKDGNKTLKTGKLLTIGEMRKLDKLRSKMKEDGSNSFEILCEMMSFIFGGEPDEYNKYTLKFVSDVIEYVKAEMTNPTIEEQSN